MTKTKRTPPPKKPKPEGDSKQSKQKLFSAEGNLQGVSDDIRDEIELATDQYFNDRSESPTNRQEWQTVFDKLLAEKMASLNPPTGTKPKQTLTRTPLVDPQKTAPPTETDKGVLRRLFPFSSILYYPTLPEGTRNEIEMVTDQFFFDKGITDPKESDWQRAFSAMIEKRGFATSFANTGPPKGTLADINFGNLSNENNEQKEPEALDTGDLTPEDLRVVEYQTHMYFREENIEKPSDEHWDEVYRIMLKGRLAQEKTVAELLSKVSQGQASAGAKTNAPPAGTQTNPDPTSQDMTDAEKAQVERRAKIVATAMTLSKRLVGQNNPMGSSDPNASIQMIQDGMNAMRASSMNQGSNANHGSLSHFERDRTRTLLDQGIPIAVPDFNNHASVLNSLQQSIQEINRMKGIFRQHLDREDIESLHCQQIGTGAHAQGPASGPPPAAPSRPPGGANLGLTAGPTRAANPTVPIFSLPSSGPVPTHIRQPVASSIPVLKPNDAMNYTWLPNTQAQAPPVGSQHFGAGLADQYIKLKSATIGLSLFPDGSPQRQAALSALDSLTDQIVRNTYQAELSAPFQNYDSYIDNKIVQSIYDKRSVPGNADAEKIKAPPEGSYGHLSVEWQKAWDRRVDKAKISGKSATDTITIPDLLDYHSYVCGHAVVNLDCQYAMLIGCTQGSLRATLTNLRRCSVPMKDAYALMLSSFHVKPSTQTAESLLGLVISEMPKDGIESVLANIVTLAITAVQDVRAEEKVSAAVHKALNVTWEFLKKWYNHEDVRKVHRMFTNAVLDMRKVGQLSAATSFAEVTLLHDLVKDQFDHSIPRTQPLYIHSNTAIMERHFYGDAMKTYMDALDRRSIRGLQGNQGINPEAGKGKEMGGFIRVDRYDRNRISELDNEAQDESPEVLGGQLAIGHEKSENDKYLEEVRQEQEAASMSLDETAALGQGAGLGNGQAGARPVKDLKNWPGCLNCGATKKEDHQGKELYYTQCPFYRLKPGKLQRECCLGFHGNEPKGCLRTGKPTNVVAGGLRKPL